MTQQSIRKIKRKPAHAPSLFQGLITSILFTAVAVILFAIIIGLADFSDGVIQIVNQLIKILAIFLGVRALGSSCGNVSIGKGALLGLIYMGFGVLLYALLSGQKMTFMGYLIDLIMGVAAGGLSSMILGSLRK